MDENELNLIRDKLIKLRDECNTPRENEVCDAEGIVLLSHTIGWLYKRINKIRGVAVNICH